MEKRFQKKSLQGLLPGRETSDFFFVTAHEHDESWRCVHVDVREVGEVRNNCGFAYAGQGQIMNLSQISGHVKNHYLFEPIFSSFTRSVDGPSDVFLGNNQ